MTDSNLITIAEFQAEAPEVDLARYTTETISGMITKASKMVSDYLLYTPLQETITDETKQARITSEGDLLIYPEKIPVASVSSIALFKGATSISLTLTDGSGNNKYNIDVTQRTIRYPWGEITLQGVPIFTDFYALRGTHFYTKITYVGGYTSANLPPTIKKATMLYLRDLLSRAQNTAGAKKISQGGITMEWMQKEGKSDLVEDAERMLRNYRRIG